MKAEFKTFPNGSNWVSGIVGDYRFDAKHFNEGSEFGINEGRVSKLTIKRLDTVGNGKDWNYGVVVSYDRGWDKRPTPSVKAEYDAVMELLENAPMRKF